MIGKIQANQIRELLQALSSEPHNADSAIPDNDTDVSVQVNHASLINQAMQASQAEEDVIDAARKLLRSEQLESLQNCREAAEDIVMFGI
jgi:hypothetical protein